MSNNNKNKSKIIDIDPASIFSIEDVTFDDYPVKPSIKIRELRTNNRVVKIKFNRKKDDTNLISKQNRK